MKIRMTQDEIKSALDAVLREAYERGVQGGSPEGEGGESGGDTGDTGDTGDGGGESGGEAGDGGGESGGEAGDTQNDSSSASPSGSEDTSKSDKGSEGKKAESKSEDKGALSLDDDTTTDVDTPTPVEIKAPEGVEVDEKVFEKFKSTFEKSAQEYKLSNEQANGLASDLAAWYVQEQLDANEEVQREKEKMHTDWAKQNYNDPDLGGGSDEGWSSAEKEIKTGLRRFASKQDVEEIASAGLGNFPAFVRIMNRIGKAFGEDSSGGANVGNTERDLTPEQKFQKLYPNSPTLHGMG